MQKPMNKYFLIVIFSLMIGAIGCDTSSEGGFCPSNIPSCCYDSLFGCGTFELPAGCSCSDYGFMDRVNAKKLLQSKPANKIVRAKGDLTGVWSGILKQKSNSCSILNLKQINGVASIRDQKRSVILTIPGYGRLTGRKNGKVTSASGTYSKNSICSSIIDINITSMKDGVASLKSHISTRCAMRPQCEANYNGIIQRNS